MRHVTKGHLYHLLGVSDYYVKSRQNPHWLEGGNFDVSSRSDEELGERKNVSVFIKVMENADST